MRDVSSNKMHFRNLIISIVLVLATLGLWMLCSLAFTLTIKPGDSFSEVFGVSIPLLVIFAPFLLGSLAIATIGAEMYTTQSRKAYAYTTIAIIALLFADFSGLFIPSNWTVGIKISEIVLTMFILISGSVLARYRMKKQTS